MARPAGNGVCWGDPEPSCGGCPCTPGGSPCQIFLPCILNVPPSTHPGAGRCFPNLGCPGTRRSLAEIDPPKPPSLAPLSEGLDYSDLTPTPVCLGALLSFLAPVCLDQGPFCPSSRGVWKRMWAPRFCLKQNCPCPKRAETPLTPKTPDTQRYRNSHPPHQTELADPHGFLAGLTPTRVGPVGDSGLAASSQAFTDPLQ